MKSLRAISLFGVALVAALAVAVCTAAPASAVAGDIKTDPALAGCPGSPFAGPRAPSAPPCPVPSTSQGDPLAATAGDVCIAVPVKTSGQSQGSCKPGQVQVSNDPARGGAIVEYLRSFLFVLNLAVGALILFFMVLGGVQYITSVGDPGRVKSAKNRIQWAITALVLYLMMYAILNFLIPGGVL